jgi:FkbM family methyltransferase
VKKFKRLYWKASDYKLVNKKKLYKILEVQYLEKMLFGYDVDCVFDVGANYGQYATMLRNEVKYKGLIISFEPIPEAAAELRKKASSDPKWIVQEQALSSSDGAQMLSIMDDTQFSSLSAPKSDEVDLFHSQNIVRNSVSVKAERLSTAYKRLKNEYEFQRPFLKMDTQGYDVEIVDNSKSIMTEFIGLQSELAIKKLYKSSVDFQEALHLYTECGFTLSALFPNNAGHFPLLIELDCLMLRSDLI